MLLMNCMIDVFNIISFECRIIVFWNVPFTGKDIRQIHFPKDIAICSNPHSMQQMSGVSVYMD